MLQSFDTARFYQHQKLPSLQRPLQNSFSLPKQLHDKKPSAVFSVSPGPKQFDPRFTFYKQDTNSVLEHRIVNSSQERYQERSVKRHKFYEKKPQKELVKRLFNRRQIRFDRDENN